MRIDDGITTSAAQIHRRNAIGDIIQIRINCDVDAMIMCRELQATKKIQLMYDLTQSKTRRKSG